MGSWFSNLHIRKREGLRLDDVCALLGGILAGRGLSPAESAEGADCSAAVCFSDDSGWYTLCADNIEFNNDVEAAEMAGMLSEKTGSPVIASACFDSDFAFMNLIDRSANVDAWARAGHAAGTGIKRRTAKNDWKDYVNDFGAFGKVLRKKYDFAEDMLCEAGAFLGLKSEQAVMCVDLPDEGLEGLEVRRMYFKLPDSAESTAKPRLEFVSHSSYPVLPGDSGDFSFQNKCGTMRGVEIRFDGPFVENEELTYDVWYLYRSEYKKLDMKKVAYADGSWAYVYRIPGLVLPGLDDLVARGLSQSKAWDKSAQYIRFEPHGSCRKVLDLTVYVIPMNHFEGYDGWNICYQRYGGDKRAAIMDYNLELKRIYEIDLVESNFMLGPLKQLDENDFDLD